MIRFWKRGDATVAPREQDPCSPDGRRSAIEGADRFIAEGNRLEDSGDFEGALERYDSAREAAPDYPRAHMNAGNALRRLGRREDAVAAHERAQRSDPTFAPARFNLGALLFEMGDNARAERELTEALRLQPDMFQAAIVLADVCASQERLEEAERHFKRALEILPDHSGAMVNYGMLCLRQGKFEEAEALFQRAKALDPVVQEADSSILFALNFRTDLDAETIAREHRRIGASMSASAGTPHRTWANTPDPGRRLRVGYVSGDFLNHSVAGFLWPVLESHDHEAVETFCFSNYPHANPVADGLRELSDHWRNISDLTDSQVVDLVREERIDLLIDLSGHTGRNRLPVFARHPAPVQVTWLGYLNTTGLDAMDFRITDSHTDPEGETERLYTETLVRLPHSQWCYVPFSWPEMVPIPHAETPGAIVFGSFNQFRKISDPCLSLWCEILANVPEASLLVLDVRQSAMRDQLLRRVERNGIDPRRVSVRGREIIPEYFARIGDVDVALDTFPYNGATTTLDVLSMGVPLVALRGERGVSRGSYSILRTLGADELVTENADEYVRLNVQLARDARWRREIRAHLRARLIESPLTDAEGFTRALEARYREMWRAWCSRR